MTQGLSRLRLSMSSQRSKWKSCPVDMTENISRVSNFISGFLGSVQGTEGIKELVCQFIVCESFDLGTFGGQSPARVWLVSGCSGVMVALSV